MQPRFTPTCVGTTVTNTRTVNTTGGSPPRAWGHRMPAASRIRSIPVHPHVRGDNLVIQVHRVPVNGSPPRAWGQRRSVGDWLSMTHRFTPTCVGTTLRTGFTGSVLS